MRGEETDVGVESGAAMAHQTKAGSSTVKPVRISEKPSGPLLGLIVMSH
jgi:hypothetical protein